MSKFITIEIPEGVARLITFTLVGNGYTGIRAYSAAFNLEEGTHFALDYVKMSEDNLVYYNQFDRDIIPVDAEELNRLRLLEKAVEEACKKEKEE